MLFDVEMPCQAYLSFLMPVVNNYRCCHMPGQHACQWALLTLPAVHALSLCVAMYVHITVCTIQAASQTTSLSGSVRFCPLGVCPICLF